MRVWKRSRTEFLSSQWHRGLCQHCCIATLRVANLGCQPEPRPHAAGPDHGLTLVSSLAEVGPRPHCKPRASTCNPMWPKTTGAMQRPKAEDNTSLPRSR